MSNYNTGNPVPSIDPRDLDDNATSFDRLLTQSVPSAPDRLGVERKTWWQMEQDAAALISPNVSALAGLSGAADKMAYFTGVGAMALTPLTAIARTLLDDTTTAAMLATLGASPAASPTFTGTPAAPTAAPGTNTTQLATTAFVDAARVILVAADALKAPLASPTLTGTPLSTTPAVGTNTTQIATAAMLQAEIANKRAWTAYTPTVTANVNTFTSASATGKHMVMFGICFIEIVITVTTKGTGSDPKVTLPFNALSGSAGHILPCREELVNGLSGSAIILSGLNQLQVTTSTNSNMATADGCVIKIQGFYPLA